MSGTDRVAEGPRWCALAFSNDVVKWSGVSMDGEWSVLMQTSFTGLAEFEGRVGGGRHTTHSAIFSDFFPVYRKVSDAVHFYGFVKASEMMFPDWSRLMTYMLLHLKDSRGALI